MKNDSKRKRWASCGDCRACRATDCGECINCYDKAKFGGSGVRKQSCVMRRCVRMNSSSGSRGGGMGSAGRPADAADAARGAPASSTADDPDEERRALLGLLALTNGSVSEADDSSTQNQTVSARGSSSTSPRTSSPTPSFSDGDDRAHRGGHRASSGLSTYQNGGPPSEREREPFRPNASQLNATAGVGGSDSFCCQLASLLAAQRRLHAQPITLRALECAGLLNATQALRSKQEGNTVEMEKLINYLVDPTHRTLLCSGLSAAAAIRGAGESVMDQFKAAQRSAMDLQNMPMSVLPRVVPSGHRA